MNTQLVIWAASLIVIPGCVLVKADLDHSSAVVTISRKGGTPISPFAFGNNYFNWVDYSKNGQLPLPGTEEAVKALRLGVLMGDNNQNDCNCPQLFDEAQMDRYIQYSRAVGAEPVMIVPVYGNHVDGGPTSAREAADIVTYVNGTRKYGVKYWTIGMEVDIYDQFFKKTTGLPVSSAAEYARIINSYAEAMKAANARAGSGVELKFVGPELGWRYLPGNDWLGPILDQCRDTIDVVSVHAYGFSARELEEERILTDVVRFRALVRDLKARVAKHARPGTPLAITEANISYEWDPRAYTAQQRRIGPGTFYAALWDVDRMGAALEEGLWNLSFWSLAETIQAVRANGTVFGFIWTDPTTKPPALTFTPEYYAQRMVDNALSGDTVVPNGVPERMSVYASYDARKAATAVLVVNKDTENRTLTISVDTLEPRKLEFAPMSINIVTLPDDPRADDHFTEYTMKMADAGSAPRDRR